MNDLFSDKPEYSAKTMVERAVRNARPHGCMDSPRWVAVQEVFGYGSTTSVDLCIMFGLDPHARVSSQRCHYCDEE
jgi:hypothetical protein